MTPRKNHIKQERLKELVNYDPETGIFTRKQVLGTGRQPAGKRADHIHTDGYAYVTVDRMIYLAHRLAWIYMTGKIPDYIDHCDNHKANNVFSNLRLATQHQNQCNHLKMSTNKSGIKGVSWIARQQRWVAQSRTNGKPNWLGSFHSKEEAEKVVKAFRELHHKEFTNHG